jgi:hypothetical protein
MLQSQTVLLANPQHVPNRSQGPGLLQASVHAARLEADMRAAQEEIKMEQQRTQELTAQVRQRC